MTSRADYYASMPEYFLLEELRNKILSLQDSSDDIIKFIIANNINVNSYVKGLKVNEWVPLLYLSCLNSKHEDLVKYLFKFKVNVQLIPDSDDIEHILFTCDGLYLKFLYDKGSRLFTENNEANIKRRLRRADIKRLTSLIKLNIISISDITLNLNLKEDLILYCLKSMTDYFKYAFNIRKDIFNFTVELNQVIQKFLKCVEQLITWKCLITEEAFLYICKYYLHEFISLKFQLNFENFENFENLVVYHEYMDKLEVAMLRPLLNDARYEKTCLKLHTIPVKELYYKVSHII